MFEGLSEKLSSILDGLTRRGALTEEDVNAALREVRRALLEADVALEVVRSFVDKVRTRAVGAEVVKSVTPGQMVVKIVHDQLVEMLGSDAETIDLNAVPPVPILMVGLQGSGKTTTTAKIAKRLTDRSGRRVLMASLDTRRPAAMEQLAILGKQVEKGKIKPEDKDALVARIRTVASPSEFSSCDLVIEAATENVELKLKLFRGCDEAMKPGAILATNTSSISLTKLAGVTKRPDRVIGMHFMNPPPLMKLVEIVRAVQTSDETYRVVRAAAEKMGKTCTTSNDAPGFLVNRILIPMLCEACFALQEGVGTPEDIDTGAKLGLNHPMGPLELSDLIGLDTVLAIADVLHRDIGDDKYRAPTMLRNLVAAGWLGKKTGRGFYEYDEKGAKKPRA